MLGERLTVIASFVPPGGRVADIGTDHALLPICLLQNGTSPRVIAVEKAEGPLRAARQAVVEASLDAVCEVRAGDGFGPVRPGEVDTAVIAGMGGQTIAGVLDTAPEGVLDGLYRLILQPMNRVADLRAWLFEHGWHIVDEELVDETGRLYEIVVAERGEAEMPEDVLLEVGPVLWAKKHPLLRQHLAGLAANYAKILEGMERSRASDTREAQARIRAKLDRLKEMMQCL